MWVFDNRISRHKAIFLKLKGRKMYPKLNLKSVDICWHGVFPSI
jgi:hypothetical protein